MIKIKSLKKLEQSRLIKDGSYNLRFFKDLAGKTFEFYDKTSLGSYEVEINGIIIFVPGDFIAYEVEL